MFTFTPKSDDELSNLLVVGDGEFEVIDAKIKTSKNGNPMIELKLMVWDSRGRQKIIYDNLVNVESFQFKIKHFCDAIGILNKYEAGSILREDIVPPVGPVRKGRLKIGISKDFFGNHPDKNKVVDYLKNKQGDAPFNDDIPF